MLLSAGWMTWLVVLAMLVSGPVVILQTANETPTRAGAIAGSEAPSSLERQQGTTDAGGNTARPQETTQDSRPAAGTTGQQETPQGGQAGPSWTGQQGTPPGAQPGSSTTGQQGTAQGGQPGSTTGRQGTTPGSQPAAGGAGQPNTSAGTPAPAAAPPADRQDLTDNIPLVPLIFADDDLEETQDVNEFIGVAFAGSTFGASASGTSLDFGGSISFLHNRTVGGELLVGYAPRVLLTKLGGTSSSVTTYMFNALGALPLGAGRWRPFVSGGFGGVSLATHGTAATVASAGGVQVPGATPTTAVAPPPETHFGGDLGAGLMAFAGRWGIRADVRYFAVRRAVEPSATATAAVPAAVTAPTPALTAATTGSSFWRGNVGIAIRW